MLARAGGSNMAAPMADTAPPAELTSEQADATMASKPFVGLLVIVSVVGVVVSFATWGFLELIYQLTQELYVHLPNALGYTHGPPVWWPLPILAVAGVVVALAISRLPGNGGHVPARGLAVGSPTTPVELPGVLLAAIAGIGCGVVLGPEAPLIALGTGLATLMISLSRRDTPPQVTTIMAAAAAFSAISFLFVSPLVAAVLMIEVTAIGGPRLRLVVVPGLLAAGIGSLLAIGLGSWTGLNRSEIALGPVSLPAFGHPTMGQFGWTIALAAAVAVVAAVILRGGLLTYRFAVPRPLIVLPIVGLIIAGLAIAFSQATDKSINEVLFSGESGLPGLISQAGTWSISALILLILFKGLAYLLSLGSFRGGPTFPAVFLGAAAGILASHLPGFPLTPAVAVGMGAATVAVLRLPLTAVVLATLLTVKSGTGDEPLIIVGVVVAYLVTLLVSKALSARTEGARPGAIQSAEPDGSAAAVAPQAAV
jgi:chloride channel protein, CIC family